MEILLKPLKKEIWSGFTNYPGCTTYIGSYWTRSGNRYTGLTKEDAERLEKAMLMVEGNLSPYSKYWVTYAVPATEEGAIIYADTPEGELQYLFLKSHKRVASSTDQVRASHDYVLIDQDLEAKQSNLKNKSKRDAIMVYGKMTTEDMRKCLRIMGYASDDLSAEIVESKLFEIIETDPNKFKLLWIDNKDRETNFLIESAISKNVIRKSKNIYYYGTDVIGHSLQDTISGLNDKANQEIKIAIMKEVEAKS